MTIRTYLSNLAGKATTGKQLSAVASTLSVYGITIMVTTALDAPRSYALATMLMVAAVILYLIADDVARFEEPASLETIDGGLTISLPKEVYEKLKAAARNEKGGNP